MLEKIVSITSDNRRFLILNKSDPCYASITSMAKGPLLSVLEREIQPKIGRAFENMRNNFLTAPLLDIVGSIMKYLHFQPIQPKIYDGNCREKGYFSALNTFFSK